MVLFFVTADEEVTRATVARIESILARNQRMGNDTVTDAVRTRGVLVNLAQQEGVCACRSPIYSLLDGLATLPAVAHHAKHMGYRYRRRLPTSVGPLCSAPSQAAR